MSAPLRPLLPAIPGENRRSPPVPTERKRKRVSAACEACRLHKSKCTGEQPTCRACIGRKTVCTYKQSESREARQKYNDLQRRTSTYEGLFDLMRILPEQEAVGLFRQVRAGADVGHKTVFHYSNTETRPISQQYDGFQQRGSMLSDIVKYATTEEVVKIFRRLQAGDTIETLVNQFKGRHLQRHLVLDMRSAYEEFYHLLKHRPEEDLTQILQLLRSGCDVETLLRRIHDGDLLLQLSLVPECQLRYEFPYNKKWPKFLCQVDNLYLNTSLYAPEELATGTISRARPDSIYGMPYHGAKLIEPRLVQASISKWTTVASDESLLSQLLELYILHSHPSLTFFHKDLFLADLESGKEQFCSSLLVNAVLASATHYHQSLPGRNEPRNTQSLCYRFFAEAKRLWELEMGESKLTTLQAALVMNSIYNMNGLDQVGNIYMVQAAKMAYQLNLFALSENRKRTDMDLASQFTAWCLFSWQAMVLCHYYKPTLFIQPPRAELPDPQEDPSFYGEIYVQYHRSEAPHPVKFPSTFNHTAKFRTMLNDLANDTFGGTKKRLSINDAIKYYQQLMEWFQNLPVCLRPSNIVFPLHLQLHLHFQHVIMLLFDPFLASDSSATLLTTLSGTNATIKEIMMQSKVEFETIIRLYYLRHSYTTYAPIMLQFLSVLGFAVIGEARKTQSPSEGLDDLRSSLLLAIQGLHYQGRAAHLSNTVFQLLYDEMPIDAASIATTYLSVERIEMDSQVLSKYIRAAYPINVVSINADVEEKRLNNLLQIS